MSGRTPRLLGWIARGLLAPAALLLAAGGAPGAEPPPRRVLCLLSGDAEPYRQVRDAFLSQLHGDGVEVQPADRVLSANEASPAEDLLRVGGEQPELILAVGSRAAGVARSAAEGTPVVYTLVLDPAREGLTEREGACGVSSQIPLERTLALLHEGMPSLKRVAILHREGSLPPDLEKVRKRPPEGVKLQWIPVADPKELPAALERVREGADALVAIPDPAVYSSASLPHIQLFCLRNQIFLFGFSVPMTKGGALVSTSVGYEALGRQCAAQAKRILEGKTAPQRIGLEPPREVEISVNLTVARRMGVRFQDAFLKQAAHKLQ